MLTNEVVSFEQPDPVYLLQKLTSYAKDNVIFWYYLKSFFYFYRGVEWCLHYLHHNSQTSWGCSEKAEAIGLAAG